MQIKILVGKPAGKKSVERAKRRWVSRCGLDS
jgi:hypothetical protein